MPSAFCAGIRVLLLVGWRCPVRGGTCLSLPPQRKAGQRKRLTLRVPVVTHGPPTSPCLAPRRARIAPLPTPRLLASPTSTSVPQPAVSNIHGPCTRSITVCHRGARWSGANAVHDARKAGEAFEWRAGNEVEDVRCGVECGDVEGPWLTVKTRRCERLSLPPCTEATDEPRQHHAAANQSTKPKSKS